MIVIQTIGLLALCIGSVFLLCAIANYADKLSDKYIDRLVKRLDRKEDNDGFSD